MANRRMIVAALVAGLAVSASGLRLHREATELESEVFTLDGLIRTTGARLEQASAVLAAHVKANATNASTSTAAGKKDVTKAPSAAADVVSAADALMHAKGHKGNVTGMLAKEQSALEGLFQKLKKNIVNFNTHDKTSKSESAAILDRLQKRLAQDKEKLKDPKLSAFQHEALVNRTGSEEREVHYWQSVIENGHRVFHANLKITHGLMKRVKEVMEAYQQALTKGHVDPKLMKQMSAASMPRAFVQMRSELRTAAGGRVPILSA